MATPTGWRANLANPTPVLLVESDGTELALSASSLTTGQVSITSAATLVFSANASRVFAEMQNLDASINIFWGQTNAVTTSTGYRIRPGDSFTLDGYTGGVYAIVASGTPTLAKIEW